MRNSRIGLTALACIFSMSACTEKIDDRLKISPIGNTPMLTELPDKTLLKIQERPDNARRSIEQAFNSIAVQNTVHLNGLQKLINSRAAGERAAIFAYFLSFDMDGNAEIIDEEIQLMTDIKTVARLGIRTPSGFKPPPLSLADIDEDGVLSMTEIYIVAQSYTSESFKYDPSYLATLGTFDTNEDGFTTRDELNNELDTLMGASTKTTRSTKPSSQRSSSRKIPQRKSAPPSEACKPAPPPKNVDVVFISTFHGGNLSSVAVSGQDNITYTSKVVIEPGEKPLYVMASSREDLVWSVEGETDRVAKFVVSHQSVGSGPGVGVIGLPKDKIEFLPKGCLVSLRKSRSSKHGEPATDGKSLQWSSLINRSPDHLFSEIEIKSIWLPSGSKKKKLTLATMTQADHDRILKEMQSGPLVMDENSRKLGLFNAKDVINIEPNTVVAPEPVESYDVYPASAGLIQLVEEGKIEAMGRGVFKIVKPISRFPAGLNGGHSVKFILGKDVPLPKGSPGHSSVKSEETGKCISRSCR